MKKEKKEKREKNSNSGLKALIICGIITLVIIAVCIFFPDEFFGLFK